MEPLIYERVYGKEYRYKVSIAKRVAGYVWYNIDFGWFYVPKGVKTPYRPEETFATFDELKGYLGN